MSTSAPLPESQTAWQSLHRTMDRLRRISRARSVAVPAVTRRLSRSRCSSRKSRSVASPFWWAQTVRGAGASPPSRAGSSWQATTTTAGRRWAAASNPRGRSTVRRSAATISTWCGSSGPAGSSSQSNRTPSAGNGTWRSRSKPIIAATSPPAARGSSIVLTTATRRSRPTRSVASGEPARLQLRGEGGRGILHALDDEVLDLAPAGRADHGDPAVVQEEADTRGPHDATPGRQETIVRSSARPGRPRRTTATTRPRGMPPTRPSASIRNVLLPTVNPRPANRPGTVG